MSNIKAKRMEEDNRNQNSTYYNYNDNDNNYNYHKRKRKKKSNKKFKRFLKRYIVFLIILMVIYLIYVVRSLRTYEDLQIDNFLSKTLKKSIGDYIDISDIELSKFESKDVNKKSALKDLLKNEDFTYKLDNESTDLIYPIYDAYLNDKAVFKVYLNGEKKITKLAILTMQDWKIDKVELLDNVGLYEVNISAPNNYKISINGTIVTEEDKSEGEQDEGLIQLAEYTEIPYIVKYKIGGLFKEPIVKIEDNDGKEVKFEKKDNNIEVGLDFKEIEDKEEALKNITGDVDILKYAEDWSLYLSDDLKGRFDSIKKYLIEDSYMWNYARKWGSSTDITYISKHTLDSPVFTNTKVNNFKIYSENAFSCEVYLEKNMIINRRKLVDKLNERMYFAYYKGEWKLVNMQSITNN